MKGAVASPTRARVDGRAQGRADTLQQGLQHRQRETATRFTIGSLAELLVGKIPEPGHRDIAVENLENKKMNRRHRIEETLAKTIANFVAHRSNLPGIEDMGKIFLNAPQGGANTLKHP